MPVRNVSNAKQISVGSEHSCALLEDGAAKCWGHNGDGEVGNGTTEDAGVGALVQELEDAIDISAGGYHSCAVLTDGTAKCWAATVSARWGTARPTISPRRPKCSGSKL